VNWTLAVLFFAIVAASPGVAHAAECPIEGDRVHWIADYCMSKLETDDEIPASKCINEEIETRFPDECVAKRHYKRALCELAIARKSRSGSVEQCLHDNRFAGPTVRNKGVGR
jgi:hypothetical protein